MEGVLKICELRMWNLSTIYSFPRTIHGGYQAGYTGLVWYEALHGMGKNLTLLKMCTAGFIV